jgi:hypothetical protein
MLLGQAAVDGRVAIATRPRTRAQARAVRRGLDIDSSNGRSRRFDATHRHHELFTIKSPSVKAAKRRIGPALPFRTTGV